MKDNDVISVKIMYSYSDFPAGLPAGPQSLEKKNTQGVGAWSICFIYDRTAGIDL